MSIALKMGFQKREKCKKGKEQRTASHMSATGALKGAMLSYTFINSYSQVSDPGPSC